MSEEVMDGESGDDEAINNYNYKAELTGVGNRSGTYSRWLKVSNQAAKYGVMWKKMPESKQFFLQSRINLGHFWSLVFSHVTKITVDMYNDVSFLFIFEARIVNAYGAA